MSTGSSQADKDALVTHVLRPAFDRLTGSTTTLFHPFEELLQPVEHVLQLVNIQSINQRGANTVNWHSPYNIINGGNLLGVGFTVKGLVVTHMLRTLGGAQGDTIQQRGRFFGYRRDWLDRTRVWLPKDVSYHFDQYIDQEEYLRNDLREFDENNMTLRGWKRRFRLDPAAKLCRKNAIRLQLYRFKTEASWIEQDFALVDPQSHQINRDLTDQFVSGGADFTLERDFDNCALANSGSTPATCHLQGVVPLKDLKLLLASYIVREENRMDFEVIRSLIDDHEDDPEYQDVTVILMAAGAPLDYRRRRALKESGGFDLMQGRGDGTGQVYQGDRAVRVARHLTVQIHRIDHGPNDSNIDLFDLRYLAISLPQALEDEAKAWVQQL